MIKLNEEMTICQICSDYFEDPVECSQCHNNFCQKCERIMRQKWDYIQLPIM